MTAYPRPKPKDTVSEQWRETREARQRVLAAVDDRRREIIARFIRKRQGQQRNTEA